VLVFPGDGAGEGAGTVPIGDAAVEPIQGIDPDGHWYRVEVDPALVTTVAGTDPGNAAVALAQRAISHQIAGASRAMLELARQHALGRVQFGRPVAQFQAVRHRLADAFVAVEALDAALAAAADAPGALSAQAAKAIAGRTARTVATHCQQVLAGVGFTTEHPFHRYLKRTMLLDGLFGSADELVVTIGHTLLSARSVPVLIEL
jgi:alkylation response protein AidB-like acyl-CoA dehydrogenase